MGVLADGNALLTLNGGSVTTTGDAVRQASFPHGLGARNPGGILTATGTTILTTGFTAMGAVADDGGTMILSDNSIRTQGESSIGLFSVTEQVGAQFPANLTATNVTLETLGPHAHGVAAQARNDVPRRDGNGHDQYLIDHHPWQRSRRDCERCLAIMARAR